MNRNPLYATAATLSHQPPRHQEICDGQVIRPPIRAAYDTEKEYDLAVRLGIAHAQANNITYIDNYDS
jgi:hypothetical protein